MKYESFPMMLTYLLAYLVVWTFALTAQGAITAWTANYFGDDTPKNAGRISLSPFVQLDLLGSVIIPGILFMLSWMSMGVPFIAWGKPMKFDWEKLGKSGKGYISVNLASTAINLVIATVSLLIMKLFFVSGLSQEVGFAQTIMHKDFGAEITWVSPIELMLWYSFAINIALSLLSLTPIPPMAGGAVLNSLIKDKYPAISIFLTRFGLIISLAFFYYVAAPYILTPVLIKSLQFLGLQ